jgi:tetratricopeptide (TPR) repeat protein
VSYDLPDRVAVRYLLVVGGLFIAVGLVGQLIPGLNTFLTLFLPAGVVLLLIAGGVFLFAHTAGAGLSRLIGNLQATDGSSTPPLKAYSAIEALEARGAYADAAAAYGAAIASAPADWEARIRLAELSLRRLNDPARAAALYAEARKLVPDERHAVAVGLRLVDIYRDRLRDRGRAIVELRRLIDTYPTSPLVAGARAELRRLLAERPAEHGT